VRVPTGAHDELVRCRLGERCMIRLGRIHRPYITGGGRRSA
jgi:hypothetical protein